MCAILDNSTPDDGAGSRRCCLARPRIDICFVVTDSVRVRWVSATLKMANDRTARSYSKLRCRRRSVAEHPRRSLRRRGVTRVT